MIYNYSIQSSVSSGIVNSYKLSNEISSSSIIIALDYVNVLNDSLEISFKASIGTSDKSKLDDIVMNHNGEAEPRAAIYSCVDVDYYNFDYRDIDYKIPTRSNLFPDREFVKGELQRVIWYKDEEKQTPVVKVDIVYTRDTFGFAQSRVTTRTWYDEQGNELQNKKITNKKYSFLDQIKEGKIRRSNIVDGIQIPVMGFMLETIPGDSGLVLLMGRNFLDRHDSEFSKFVDNSSSITDINDPNFGKKSIVVALENASETTDTWLKNKPASMGGSISILNYLVSEFSI